MARTAELNKLRGNTSTAPEDISLLADNVCLFPWIFNANGKQTSKRMKKADVKNRGKKSYFQMLFSGTKRGTAEAIRKANSTPSTHTRCPHVFKL